MTLPSDSTGILRPQESGPFIDRFHKIINARISGMEGEAALTLLRDIRDNLLAEESAVNRSVSDIEALLHNLESPDSNEDLELLITSFHQLAAEQFKKRASASTFHSHYSRFLELLIAYAISTASAMLENEGIHLPQNSWCLLVSGGLGRHEPSRRHPGRVILLYENSGEFSREYFDLFAYRTMAILEPLITREGKRTVSGKRQFWSGSTTEWLELVDIGMKGGINSSARSGTLADENLFADTFSMVADMRPLYGALPLAEAVIGSSRKKVALELSGELFWQCAKQTATMPVAIGIFGNIKTMKQGKHRGEIPLEELAIKPLISSIRALAVSHGITATSTVARIKGILATGNIGVTLADRLLIAYHDFTKTLIEREQAGAITSEKIFFNPETLDEPSRERFRSGLEDLTTLQRLVYQQLVEVD